MPTVGQRRKFLLEVEKQRGQAAADRLKSDMRKLWDAARPAAGAE
jgi:hypothetical protein